MIKLSNITKRFGATLAVAGVSAEFLAGEVHCLLGENGAGKSTLGKIMGGLYRPDEGHVEIDGNVQQLSNPRAAHALGLAVCYQELSLAAHLSVRANLCLGSEAIRQPFTRIDKAAECAAVEAVLRKLGLDVDTECTVGDLPVAQQQLIEIGKALLIKPRAIVFDEPTAMLGAVEKGKFLAVLRQLRAEGVAAILITHHIEDVMAVSDRVTIMRNGSVVDSFVMEPRITADDVVERLTGKKREPAAAGHSRGHAPGTPALEIQNLRWRDQTSKALRIHKGQIASFYGVVGCGAERIVAALVGSSSEISLTCQVFGREHRPSSTAHALKSGVAYLPAGRAANCILPGRSIVENLTLSVVGQRSRFGVIQRAAEAKDAEATLRAAGVKFSDPSQAITDLSGGNQQKVVLARAMAAARNLLILEEPTAGVDIDAKAQIHARIREAADRGLTVIMTSSDLEETVSLSDVIFTMYRSEIAGMYEAPDLTDEANIIADVLGQPAPEPQHTQQLVVAR